MQKVDSEKMAAFIAARRKARGLTQKALAGELGVTDKAVSKWERGLSCPDITLLAKLAELLGATTSELLDGALAGGEAHAPEVERLVESTLAYADTATKEKARRLPRIAQAVITALCATGIGTCFICDLAISGGLTWARLVGAAILYFWLVAIPPIRWGRKKGVALSLAALCLGLLPFLYT
ncbi:helix-turn-helix domain-containing protein, partial [Akkermansia muciniphila]|uniref:helix-turn-helix domain-containing protein n=1 Tax=Akkermansia muciniphila TaxID=239935 RepID=UPI00138665FB